MGSTRHANRQTESAVDGRPNFVALLQASLPADGLWTMPVVAAVSGGADSVALLMALRQIVPSAVERRLIVVHAEHDLRLTAADDRAFVERLADRLGLAMIWRRLGVHDADDHGEGIEARARRLRYGFLAEVAADVGARHVLVAHTADDQAETILHRMLRGTGLAGLGGMAAARALSPGVSLLRPMLGLSRADARAFLSTIGQEWREDPSNADPRHARNFLRHEVFPRCEAGPFPAATASLVRLGHQAAVVTAAIRSAAEHLLESCSCRHADGSIVLRINDLARLDAHLVAEVFVALWRREGWPQRDMTAKHYTALAEMVTAEKPTPTAFDAPGRVAVRRLSDGQLTVARNA
ncbi:MAG: tRNA lysidine(34) synthetase TilS [Planctomycetia bacterium]|nr:tRNA lysidine(34) synthetase TilS [Planctomycetia bacterium]